MSERIFHLPQMEKWIFLCVREGVAGKGYAKRINYSRIFQLLLLPNQQIANF